MAHHVAIQNKAVKCAIVMEAFIIPSLAEGDVNGVFLVERINKAYTWDCAKNIPMAFCDSPIKQIGTHSALHGGKQNKFGCRRFLFPGIPKEKGIFLNG